MRDADGVEYCASCLQDYGAQLQRNELQERIDAVLKYCSTEKAKCEVEAHAHREDGSCIAGDLAHKLFKMFSNEVTWLLTHA